jgi:hypothetical protein
VGTRAGKFRIARWAATPLVALALASLGAAAADASPPPAGVLVPSGCISTDGAGDSSGSSCAVGAAVDAAGAVTVSPDGKSVYVGSDFLLISMLQSDPAGIAVFSRNPATGTLTQLAGAGGCFTTDGSSQAGAGKCTTAQGLARSGTLDDVNALAVAPDGDWLYAASSNYPGVLIFKRNPTTGALSQLAGDAGCITADGSSQAGAGTCQSDPVLQQPTGLKFSSDGRFLYVTDSSGDIHVFAQNGTTGQLTDVECLSQEASVPPGCAAGRDLGGSLVITPNGDYAYSTGGGISVLKRNPNTGLLTEVPGAAGCVSDDGDDSSGLANSCTQWRVVGNTESLSISPDGNTLYAVSHLDNGVAALHVNGDGTLTQSNGSAGCITATGTDNLGAAQCAVGRGLQSPLTSTISPDGATLYVTSATGVATLLVNSATGVLSQRAGSDGCASADGSSGGIAGQCAIDPDLQGTNGIAIGLDGTSAYATSSAGTRGVISLLARQTAPSCSSVSGQAGYQTALSLHLSCTDADRQPVTLAIGTGPAHGKLGAIDQANDTIEYTPAAGFSGTDGFSFTASDGTNVSAPAGATITVSGPTKPHVTLRKGPTATAGGLRVTLACRDATCKLSAELTTVETLVAGHVIALRATRRKGKGTGKLRAVVVGRASVTVRAGHTLSLLLALNGLGRKLLGRFGRVPATVTFTVHDGAPARIVTRAVTIRTRHV